LEKSYPHDEGKKEARQLVKFAEKEMENEKKTKGKGKK